MTVDKTEHMFYTFYYQMLEIFSASLLERQVNFMEKILEAYYGNNAKKLHNMVDKILFKLGVAGLVDRDDFYSLANEVFADILQRYEKTQSFDGYLYTCLCNQFKTELTKRNRLKRQIDRLAISIDTPVDDEDGSTVGDMIADSFSIEKVIFEDREESYSRKMREYLSRLSGLQREVLRLATAEYQPNEIKAELHISEKQYSDCNAAIHSYRNVSVLF